MIRIATEADIPVLVEMSRNMALESDNYRFIEFNESHMADFLKIIINNIEKYCVFVSENEFGINGMFSGVVNPYMFNFDVLYSGDIGLYVLPEYRGRRVAYALIKKYEEWAMQKNVSKNHIKLGLSTTLDEKVNDFYIRIGYSHSGNFYVRC